MFLRYCESNRLENKLKNKGKSSQTKNVSANEQRPTQFTDLKKCGTKKNLEQKLINDCTQMKLVEKKPCKREAQKNWILMPFSGSLPAAVQKGTLTSQLT